MYLFFFSGDSKLFPQVMEELGIKEPPPGGESFPRSFFWGLGVEREQHGVWCVCPSIKN